MNTEILEIEIYKEVLSGKRKRFPKNFWKYFDIPNLKAAQNITKYLIQDILHWSNEDIKANISLKTFSENKLSGMLMQIFHNSPFQALNNAFPGQFKEWELSITPRNFWTLENAKNATIWLIDEKLQWNDEQIKTNLTQKIFEDYGLRGMLGEVFDEITFKAIENAYSGKFKEWEFSITSKNFWTLENAKSATIWLIDEKLQWNDEQIKVNLCQKSFFDNGLRGMLKTLFNGSPFKALNNAFPGKFKEWELAHTPQNFWDLKTAQEATIWLLKEKLQWSDTQIKQNLSSKTFINNGLQGMLSVLFKGSPYRAINNAYPGKFKPQDFSNLPKNY